MLRQPILVVLAILVAALGALAYVGIRVMRSDRDALYERYANERAQALDDASHGVSSEIEKIGGDLDLACALLEDAESPQIAERQLRAMATIKREYLVVAARHDGVTTRVVDASPPPNAASLAALADQAFPSILDAAEKSPGVLRISGPIGGGDAAWYRVYARRLRGRSPTVAALVDTSLLLAPLDLLADANTEVLVGNGDGIAPVSDARLAANRAEVAGLLDEARAGRTATRVLDAPTAVRLGLPDTTAIAVAVPLRVDRGAPWGLVVVSSTIALATQEETLVRRVLVGGVLALVLLLAAAGYVIYSTRRTAQLRERARSEARLIHSEKLVTAGQLAAGIAHEIGTPLGVARGRVELALSHLGAEHADAKNHTVAIDQIDRVTKMIQQLLDYVRPTKVEVQSVDAGRAIRNVIDLLGVQATKRNVAFEVDVEPDLPALRADPDQLQQVLVNLALNAIDACEKRGTVELRAARRGQAVVLEVHDDGAGIPKDLRAQVFDPFFTTKKRGQGTGLGLWVVAQLVRANAAEIELDSAPGKGTTATVTWPVFR